MRAQAARMRRKHSRREPLRIPVAVLVIHRSRLRKHRAIHRARLAIRQQLNLQRRHSVPLLLGEPTPPLALTRQQADTMVNRRSQALLPLILAPALVTQHSSNSNTLHKRKVSAG